jgi:hypothetical protein
MIRTLIVVALLLTGGSAIAQPQDAFRIDASDRVEIEKAILGQMAAFKSDNGHAAFAFAAPSVRERFGSPETFMEMVRENYQPVYNPRSVRFGALSPSHVGPVQHVFILDPNAVAFVALYLMDRDADGRWQIAGCILRPREALDA